MLGAGTWEWLRAVGTVPVLGAGMRDFRVVGIPHQRRLTGVIPHQRRMVGVLINRPVKVGWSLPQPGGIVGLPHQRSVDGSEMQLKPQFYVEIKAASALTVSEADHFSSSRILFGGPKPNACRHARRRRRRLQVRFVRCINYFNN